MSRAETAPFERLVKLIERELELAGAGRARELQDAVAMTGRYLRTLPSPAPNAAQPTLRRAAALRGRVRIETLRLRESVALRRAALRRARKLWRTYEPQRTATGRVYSSSV